ncbi:MAG TPA: 30S ribosomal protein S8, partial [Candidatus Latescibacteria bacterium]|nr:30S ribosomal protein S8 [Candidatus Latescibacterota bacterium]
NKRECIVMPASKLVGEVLRIMQLHGYLGEIEYIDDGRFGKYRAQLLGRINECKAIRPRYPAKAKEIASFERQYLPARGLGILILSTNKGIMTSEEARRGGLGGVLLAYVY